MRVDPVDLEEVCVTALVDPKSALNCLTSLSRNEVSLVLIWSHQAVPILLRNLRTAFSAQWGICHFVLHVLVVWGHKAGRTNVSLHRPGLPPRSSRWQPVPLEILGFKTPISWEGQKARDLAPKCGNGEGQHEETALLLAEPHNLTPWATAACLLEEGDFQKNVLKL